MLSMKDTLVKITKQFLIKGTIQEIKKFGSGHINDSYYVKTIEKGCPDYMLQRINHNIFKDVPALQKNIYLVTQHIKCKLKDNPGADLNRQVLSIIPTHEGRLYEEEDGNFWRLMIFVSESKSYDQISSPGIAYECGYAYANFQSQLSDLPISLLNETIPYFHHLGRRMDQFKIVLKSCPADRKDEAKREIKIVEEKAEEILSLEKFIQEKQIKKRIIHFDTKINNILFDKNDKALCIVDLDTVMPGYVFSDFGDAIRTAANTGAEDEKNLQNVSINMDIYKSFSLGYLSAARYFLTSDEISKLALSAKFNTYLQAVRFLIDFLDGSKYYKIEYPMHNLQRTKAQIQLLLSMDKEYDLMCKIIEDIIKGK